MLEVEAQLREWYLRAENLQFPMFVGPERESTPLNATPYVAHIRQVREGAILLKRSALLRQLIAAVDDLRASSVQPIAALLGGSAIGPKPDPSDLDCVIFYELPEQKDQARGFGAFQRHFKSHGLDLRLIPADGDPVLFIKAVSFFSALYAKNAGDDRIVRGLVLLDCRDE
ncbi:DUF6932 family protein [Sphingomonas sp. DT-207]|uniref:DUF6932 family protein n=1 Tax=Sphingomonas sp. DT-207 TaxID=3396167 RepID=UPI003F1B8986